MIQSITVFNPYRKVRIQKSSIRAYVQRVVGNRKCNISVVFVDSHYCTSINRRYLNHNYSTDVLAFVLEKAPPLEGEIYVNLDRAKEQASEYRVSFANEVARLVIHGTLHLIGYDDRTATAHKKMKAIENKHVRHWFPGKQRKSP